MKNKKLLFLLFTVIVCLSIYAGEQMNREYEIVGSDWRESVEVYKTADGTDLNAYVFSPSEITDGQQRPVILFFHGGGWYEGDPAGFTRNCKTFSLRGWVAVSFEYRLSNFRDINPVHCIMDAKSAVRWVRQNAERLNIDPNRIVIAGQSAGGHLALSTGILDDYDDPQDDLSVSCVPNAIICYSACFDPQRDSWFSRLLPDNISIESVSPFANLRPNLPPVLIFHGEQDDLTLYRFTLRFYNRMREFGNHCELISFESGVHNLWPDYHQEIRVGSENFLIGLGFAVD